jgi:hypothetical protein
VTENDCGGECEIRAIDVARKIERFLAQCCALPDAIIRPRTDDIAIERVDARVPFQDSRNGLVRKSAVEPRLRVARTGDDADDKALDRERQRVCASVNARHIECPQWLHR